MKKVFWAAMLMAAMLALGCEAGNNTGSAGSGSSAPVAQQNNKTGGQPQVR